MALVFALYLLLCVRVTADIRAGLADGALLAESGGLGIDCAAYADGAGGRWRDGDARGRYPRGGGRAARGAGADGMQRYPRHGGFCRARRLGGGTVHSFHAGWRYYACGGEGGREKEAKRGVAMEKHPIESLMGVSMEQIKDMVDVNTVIGDAVQTQDGSTIIPISRVSFGFVAGGGEYAVSGAQAGAYGLPFAGGAGAGVSIHPMGFLVCGRNGVRLLSAGSASPMERVAELIPQALENWKRLGDEQENAKPSPVRAAYQE